MILPKVFFAHIVFSILSMLFVYCEWTYMESNTMIHIYEIIFSVVISLGYIFVGYWINDGYIEGIKQIISIAILSMIIIFFSLLDIVSGVVTQKNIGFSVIFNLPYFPLYEYIQRILPSKWLDAVAYILLNLLPSSFIYLGVVSRKN